MREEPTAWGSHVSDSKWDRSGFTLELISEMPWASTRGMRGRPEVPLHQRVRCQQAAEFGELEGRGLVGRARGRAGRSRSWGYMGQARELDFHPLALRAATLLCHICSEMFLVAGMRRAG